MDWDKPNMNKTSSSSLNSGLSSALFLRACLEVLAGQHSYLCIPLLYGGQLSSLTEPTAVREESDTSQPDQPNQPWQPMGDRCQPDRPHIQHTSLKVIVKNSSLGEE